MSPAAETRESVTDMFNRDGSILVFGAFDRDLRDSAALQVRLAVSSAVRLERDYALLIFDTAGHDEIALQRFIGAMHFFRPSDSFRYVGYVMTTAYANDFDLLQHCDWRVTHPGALLQIEHSPLHLDNQDLAELYDAPAQALAYERARIAYMIDMYCRRSGQSAKKIQSRLRARRVLTPQQAMELGLIDEIVETLPTASVRPDYRLNGVLS
jgi:hypothetical protein